MWDLQLFFAISLTLVLFGLVLHEILLRQARRRFTQATGLSLTKTNWRFEIFSGIYSGHHAELAIWPARRNSGTQITIMVKNETQRAFSLAEDPLYRKAESFGATVFRSGDENFDQRFTFKTRSEQFAQALLSQASLRRKLLELDLSEIWLTGDQLQCWHWRDLTERNVDYAVLVLDMLCDIARIVENFKTEDVALSSQQDAQPIRS